MVIFTQQYKANLDKLSERMKDRVSGGGASGVELERIKSRSTTAASAIDEARSEDHAAVVEFHRLTGVMPLGLQIPASLMPAIPTTVDEVLEASLRAYPELRQAEDDSHAADSGIGKAFSNLLPKLAVEYTDTRTWNAGGAAFETLGATSVIYPYTNDRRVMGVFTWTLNGGVDFGEGMASLARARIASYHAIDVRQRLEESIRVSYDALNSEYMRFQNTSQALEANQKVTVAFEQQYLAGSRQLLDLLDAYERLYSSQTELVRVMVAEANAGFQLRRSMGELVPAILSSDKD